MAAEHFRAPSGAFRRDIIRGQTFAGRIVEVPPAPILEGFTWIPLHMMPILCDIWSILLEQIVWRLARITHFPLVSSGQEN